MTATTAHPLFRSVALFILLLVPSAASAQIPQFDAFYVFGDSLADSGNILIQTDKMGLVPPAPPSEMPHRAYFDGRFSNGPVGVEYLWQRLTGYEPGSSRGLKPFLSAPWIQKPGAINFAFGGTGTPYVDRTPGGFLSPGLKGQVELFRLALRWKKPSSHALYAISTGANDYRDDPFNIPMNPVSVVRNIEDAIVSLYRLGARDILVVDLPDLGKVPANLFHPDPEVSVNATALSEFHNGLLYAMLDRVQLRYPRLHLIPVKLGPLFSELEDRGWNAEAPLMELFARYEGMSACLFLPPGPVNCLDVPDIAFTGNFRFIFWDVVHPTSTAHRALSGYMFDQLTAEY